MPRGLETVNISRAATLTNLFYLFFHGGKSAVVPFITLFFRLIGLSALQVGVIIAAKTLTGLIWAPLWARCAAAYNRQRFILMFSLFMLIITNLSFPALYTQLAQREHCFPSVANASTGLPANMQHGQTDHTTLKPSATGLSTAAPSSKPLLTTSSPSKTSALIKTSTSTTSAPTTTSTTTSTSTSTSTTSTTEVLTSTTTIGKLPVSTVGSTTSLQMEELYEEAVKALQSFGLTPAQVIAANLSAHEMYEEVQHAMPGYPVTEDIIKQLFKMLVEREGAGKKQSERAANTEESSGNAKSHKRHKRSEWVDYGQIKSKLASIQSSLRSDKTLLCLVILTIVIGGEIFASPVEKVADDSWFDFLNRIDDLERYGQQRFWGSFAFVVVPIIVTVAVDNSPCFLPFHLHHFLLHFYILAVLMGAALIITCCYPVPPPASAHYPSKLCKALRVICCDARGFLFSLTLLFAGMVYASFHNFLFWRIQDLGGSESTMGLCVSAGAFAEIPMLILSTHIVKRLGNGWSVSLALFILSVRVACYSAIPFAWAIIPVEFSHGITHTMLWFAILSYDDFNVGASIDRSIRSILSSFYFGTGFSAGSLLSGYLYEAYGAQVLYWSASLFTIGWCLLYSVVQKCLPRKEKVRYIKLLRADSDNSDDNDDDDWLEMALREK